MQYKSREKIDLVTLPTPFLSLYLPLCPSLFLPLSCHTTSPSLLHYFIFPLRAVVQILSPPSFSIDIQKSMKKMMEVRLEDERSHNEAFHLNKKWRMHKRKREACASNDRLHALNSNVHLV